MDARKFGDKLYELRKREKLTQRQLANKLNVSDKLISKWENGLSIPNTEMVADICNIFHVEINDLLEISAFTTNKKQNKRINFTPKTRIKLKIFLISVLSIFIFLVSYFHFVPMLFKSTHLSKLSYYAENNFNNGYVNINLQLEIDGKRTRQSHKGNIDNENIIYEIKENDYPKYLLYNDVLIDYKWPCKKPIDTSNVKNAKDLFSFYAQNVENSGIGFTEKDLNIYKVRKIGSTYKVFFKTNITVDGVKFKKGVFNCHIKDDKIDKIDFYIDVNIKEKFYRAKGFFDFCDFKPEVTVNQDVFAYQWRVDNIKKVNELTVKELKGTVLTKERSSNQSNFIGYKNFLIYSTTNDNNFFINFLDLSKDKINTLQFPYNVSKIVLNFVYDDKLYILARENYKNYIFTYDLKLEQFERLENNLSCNANIVLFDKVYILDYNQDRTSKISYSLDGNCQFSGEIFYQKGDTILTSDSFKSKVYEYNNATIVKEYSIPYLKPARFFEINEYYNLIVDIYNNGTLYTNNFIESKLKDQSICILLGILDLLGDYTCRIKNVLRTIKKPEKQETKAQPCTQSFVALCHADVAEHKISEKSLVCFAIFFSVISELHYVTVPTG